MILRKWTWMDWLMRSQLELKQKEHLNYLTNFFVNKN